MNRSPPAAERDAGGPLDDLEFAIELPVFCSTIGEMAKLRSSSSARANPHRKGGRTRLRAASTAAGPEPPNPPAGDPLPAHRWTFLTNHAHVLILLARDSSLILRTVAQQVGITERAVQRIIADLEEAGCIERTKVGRRNTYRIRTHRPLRHPIEAHRSIGDLIRLVE